MNAEASAADNPGGPVFEAWISSIRASPMAPLQHRFSVVQAATRDPAQAKQWLDFLAEDDISFHAENVSLAQ